LSCPGRLPVSSGLTPSRKAERRVADQRADGQGIAAGRAGDQVQTAVAVEAGDFLGRTLIGIEAELIETQRVVLCLLFEDGVTGNFVRCAGYGPQTAPARKTSNSDGGVGPVVPVTAGCNGAPLRMRSASSA